MSDLKSGVSGSGAIEGSKAWYVVRCKPNRELYAQENLRRQGFQTFLPRIRKSVRHARKTSIRIAPLFSGYLFVTFDQATDRWRSIQGTLGVAQLLLAGESPKRVPDGVVQALIDKTDGAGFYQFHARLVQGDTVRFATGPFMGYLGTLTQLNDEGRVQVLLTMLGAQREICTSSKELIPAIV
jgi:transcriptional antiterminator RfaH